MAVACGGPEGVRAMGQNNPVTNISAMVLSFSNEKEGVTATMLLRIYLLHTRSILISR